MSVSTEFDSIIAKLPKLLEELEASAPLTRGEFHSLPQRGIYVFYDEVDVPIYVGRSNRLRSRLLEHGRQSSLHNSATFAFILAMEDCTTQKYVFPTKQRGLLQKVPEFRERFVDAKKRVSSMRVRVIEITDPVEQTIFEVYAALALGTRHNSFENH